MQRLIVLAGAGAVVAVLAFLYLRFSDVPSGADEALTEAVTTSATVPFVKNVSLSKSQIAPPQDKLPSFRENLSAALGSPESDLLAIYREGAKADASSEQKYVAYQILNMCLSSITRCLHADLPQASGQVVNEVHSARAEIAKRCSVMGTIGTDQLLRDAKTLGSAVEAKDSPHSRGYAGFSSAHDDAQLEAAKGRLAGLFKAYGPIALQWQLGEFSDYLRTSKSAFAQDLKSMSSDRRLSDYATMAAMCESDSICDEKGLLYLWMCSESGMCGGSVKAGLGSSLSPEELRLANAMSHKIIEGIGTGQWAHP